MSQKDVVAVEFPIGLIAGAAAGIGVAAVGAAAVLGKGAQAMFSNQNLEKAARALCPNVQISGPTMTVTTSNGITLRFEPRERRYRPVPIGKVDAKKAQEALGQLTQRYALLQIKDVAAVRRLTVLTETTEPDGQVRIRLRTEPCADGRSGEVSADVGTDGNLRLEAHQMRGTACASVIQPLVDALGVVLEETKKVEYYESEWTTDEDKERERTS